MEVDIGKIYYSPWTKRYICTTEVKEEIVHFYFLDNPEQPNSRHYKIFRAVFNKFNGPVV